MPKLRRLNGKQVIDILTRFGYEVIRIWGSHHRLQYHSEAETSYVAVSVHGTNALAIGTLKAIYRAAIQSIPEEVLKEYFYD